MSAADSPQQIPFLDLVSIHDEIRAEVDAAFREVVDQNAFIGGPWVGRFEEEFGAYCERRRCVAVGNGTDALALILRGLGVGRGDEVIVPANTFIATAEAVLHVGAVPVFADVDPDRLLMTADTVAPHLTDRTAACIVVHLFGQMANMDELCALTDRAGIALIEDAAQAHGATWNGRKAGSFGVAAGFSFYPGKNLGAFGDGGAVTTNDEELAAVIASLINHGREPDDRYLHGRVGVNSRLDGLQAAILSIKLGRIDEWNTGRREAHQRYLECLADSEIVCLAGDGLAIDVHHLEVVRTPDRDRAQAVLDAHGIGHGIHYPVPCHRQSAYKEYARDDLPVATEAAREILSVPMFPRLDASRVEHVCAALCSVFG